MFDESRRKVTEPSSSLSHRVAAGRPALRVPTQRPGNPSWALKVQPLLKMLHVQILIIALSDFALVVRALKMIHKNQLGEQLIAFHLNNLLLK